VQVPEVAKAVGAKEDQLQRVLRFLVSQGIFEEPQPGEFWEGQPWWDC
jgi:hypothetical protein